MPLVGPKGIYCFYSRRLVEVLAAAIGDRSCEVFETRSAELYVVIWSRHRFASGDRTA